MATITKARVWTVGDLAAHLGISHRRAKRMLHRIDREMGGRLLIPSEGACRRYEFVRAVLARARPEYFESVESQEAKIAELEERLAETERRLRMLGSQVGSNSFAISQLQQGARRGPRAA